jgi:hypothetical protein
VISGIDRRADSAGDATNYVVKHVNGKYVLEYYTVTLWVVRNGPLAVKNATIQVAGVLMEANIRACSKGVLRMVMELENAACGLAERYTATKAKLGAALESGEGTVTVRLRPMVKRHYLLNIGVLASKSCADQAHIGDVIEHITGMDWSAVTKLDSSVYESDFGKEMVASKAEKLVVFTVADMPGRHGEELDHEMKELATQIEDGRGVKILRLYGDKYAVARPVAMTEEEVKRAALAGKKEARRVGGRLTKAGPPGDRTTVRVFAVDLFGDLRKSFDVHGVRLLKTFSGSQMPKRAFLDTWCASRGEGVGVVAGEHGRSGVQLANIQPAGKRNQLLATLAAATATTIREDPDIIDEYGTDSLPGDAIKMYVTGRASNELAVKVVAKHRLAAEIIKEYLANVTNKFSADTPEFTTQAFTIYTGDAAAVEKVIIKEQTAAYNIDHSFISQQEDLVAKIPSGFAGRVGERKLVFKEMGTDGVKETKYRHVTELSVSVMSEALRPLNDIHRAVVGTGAKIATPSDIKKLVTSDDVMVTEALTGDDQIERVMHRMRFKVQQGVLCVLKSKSDVAKVLKQEVGLKAKGLIVRQTTDTVRSMLKKGVLHASYAKAVQEAISPSTSRPTSKKAATSLSQSIRSRHSVSGFQNKSASLRKVKQVLEKKRKRPAEVEEETRALAVQINTEREAELVALVEKTAKKQRIAAVEMADKMALTAIQKGNVAYATHDADEHEIDAAIQDMSVDGSYEGDEEEGSGAGGGRVGD